MKSLAWLVATTLLVTACKKDEPAPAATPPPAPAPTPTAGSGSAGSGSAGSGSGSGSALSETEKVAARIKENAAEAAVEKARWTPALEASALALRDQKHENTKAALTAILASDHRVPGHKDRDAARHPIETLAFFQIQPTSTVVELGAGGGWYTELLAPLLAAQGKLVVAGPDPDGPADKMQTAYGKDLVDFLAKSKLFERVERVAIKPPAISLGADGSATHVIAMREMHNWQRRGQLDAYLAAVHAVLRDGGIFGIEAHRAKPGTKGEDTAESGYLAEEWVIAKVEAAGFKLAEKSEINANPKDTKDYPEGVWTLPPNFAEGDTDKAKYAAIGESDRMTLRFTKVAKK
jgi:predicted methyltransferase